MLYSKLLAITYEASGSQEPIERFYSSQFGSYFEKFGGQPSCTVVNAILRGTRLPPRKLMRFYSDPEHPRCPEKMRGDLEALIDTCFADGVRRRALRRGFEAYLSALPPAEATDLREIIVAEDLPQMWACLIWHALTVDYEQASH